MSALRPIPRGDTMVSRLSMVFVVITFARAMAQDVSSPLIDTRDPQTTSWQVGVRIEAVGGHCADLFATLPVPTEWPEQKVRLVKEELAPYVKATRFRDLEHGVRQLMVQIPTLPAGQSAEVLLTYEIDRFAILAPTETENLRIPQRPSRELKKFLGNSPYIQVSHNSIRKLAKELVDDELPAWRQVEVFYDHVREHVAYMNGPLKGAVAALRDGTGDCEELTSLFIALCRAHGVPARTVWIPDHCYPEFYLEDENGHGQWYPCQAAGSRSFGSMRELRPILQKGDSFKVPEKKERQRYVAEFLTGSSAGRGKPKVEFIRRKLSSAN